jgi:hypothetical protein
MYCHALHGKYCLPTYINSLAKTILRITFTARIVDFLMEATLPWRLIQRIALG